MDPLCKHATCNTLFAQESQAFVGKSGLKCRSLPRYVRSCLAFAVEWPGQHVAVNAQWLSAIHGASGNVETEKSFLVHVVQSVIHTVCVQYT